MNIKNTFLYQLFKTDKVLFAVFIIYWVGVAFGWRLDREQFPFLLYGMYSLKEKPKDSYTAYTIEINEKEILASQLLNPKKENIFTTTSHFDDILESDDHADNKLSFFKWLLRYSDKHGLTSNSIKVYKVECQYDMSGKLSVKEKKLIGQYDE